MTYLTVLLQANQREIGNLNLQLNEQINQVNTLKLNNQALKQELDSTKTKYEMEVLAHNTTKQDLLDTQAKAKLMLEKMQGQLNEVRWAKPLVCCCTWR